MKLNQSTIRFAVVALAACSFCISLSLAGHKPDHNPGGGGGEAPGGTVYFRMAGGIVAQMNADGSNPQLLPDAPSGHPSHLLHAGERWFAGMLGFGDPFPNGHAEVWAGSETGALVQLVNEPDIEIITPPIFTPDDLSVSFIGERWLLDGAGQPQAVVEAGLYQVDLAYDGDGNLIGSDPGSLTFLADLSSELRIDVGGVLDSDQVVGHSWSPNQAAAVFGVRTQTSPFLEEIWVLDLSLVAAPYTVPAEALLMLDDRNGVGWPEWSPDGSRIGYVSTGGTVVYDILTGEFNSLRDTSRYSWGSIHWSPDGTHCIVARWNDSESESDGIYRFTADLKGKTELTQGFCAPEDHCILNPLSWR